MASIATNSTDVYGNVVNASWKNVQDVIGFSHGILSRACSADCRPPYGVSRGKMQVDTSARTLQDF